MISPQRLGQALLWGMCSWCETFLCTVLTDLPDPADPCDASTRIIVAAVLGPRGNAAAHRDGRPFSRRGFQLEGAGHETVGARHHLNQRTVDTPSSGGTVIRRIVLQCPSTENAWGGLRLDLRHGNDPRHVERKGEPSSNSP